MLEDIWDLTKHQKKGEIDLAFKVGAKIPKDESSSFGYALLGWTNVLVIVTHVPPPVPDDSDFDKKKGAFHTHVLNLTGAADCGGSPKIDPAGVFTDPGYKNKVGKDKIKIKKVSLSDLGAPLETPVKPVVAAFTVTEGTAGSLCVNVINTIIPDVKLKK